MKLFLLVALTGLGLAQLALASTGYDADGDGVVTMEEAKAILPTLSDAEFTAMDANGDGVLDADELTAAQEAGQLPAQQG